MRGLPFSSAVKAGDSIFVSGQSGYQDTQGNLVEGIEAQMRNSLEKIREELDSAEASLKDVVKVLVFVKNAEDWPRMNEVYQEYFPEDRPARSAIVVELVKPEALIEIEAIAYKQ